MSKNKKKRQHDVGAQHAKQIREAERAEEREFFEAAQTPEQEAADVDDLDELAKSLPVVLKSSDDEPLGTMRIEVLVNVNGIPAGTPLTIERNDKFFSGLVRQNLAKEI